MLAENNYVLKNWKINISQGKKIITFYRDAFDVVQQYLWDTEPSIRIEKRLSLNNKGM